ncbi:hypothetical protein Tco_0781408 [Tanacetum coccineum]
MARIMSSMFGWFLSLFSIVSRDDSGRTAHTTHTEYPKAFCNVIIETNPGDVNKTRIVPAFLKELIYKVLGLQVSILELDQFGILLGEREEGQVSIVMGGIFSIEARDMDTKLLLALESNNTLARCWFRRNIPVTMFGSWHDNARSCMMQSAFLTQRTVSKIPIVFSWSDSIRPEGFLSSVLLWLVIIVAVVGVGVMVVVVVVVESYSVVKLSFVIT